MQCGDVERGGSARAGVVLARGVGSRRGGARRRGSHARDEMMKTSPPYFRVDFPPVPVPTLPTDPPTDHYEAGKSCVCNDIIIQVYSQGVLTRGTPITPPGSPGDVGNCYSERFYITYIHHSKTYSRAPPSPSVSLSAWCVGTVRGLGGVRCTRGRRRKRSGARRGSGRRTACPFD